MSRNQAPTAPHSKTGHHLLGNFPLDFLQGRWFNDYSHLITVTESKVWTDGNTSASDLRFRKNDGVWQWGDWELFNVSPRPPRSLHDAIRKKAMDRAGTAADAMRKNYYAANSNAAFGKNGNGSKNQALSSGAATPKRKMKVMWHVPPPSNPRSSRMELSPGGQTQIKDKEKTKPEKYLIDVDVPKAEAERLMDEGGHSEKCLKAQLVDDNPALKRDIQIVRRDNPDTSFSDEEDEEASDDADAEPLIIGPVLADFTQLMDAKSAWRLSLYRPVTILWMKSGQPDKIVRWSSAVPNVATPLVLEGGPFKKWRQILHEEREYHGKKVKAELVTSQYADPAARMRAIERAEAEKRRQAQLREKAKADAKLRLKPEFKVRESRPRKAKLTSYENMMLAAELSGGDTAFVHDHFGRGSGGVSGGGGATSSTASAGRVLPGGTSASRTTFPWRTKAPPNFQWRVPENPFLQSFTCSDPCQSFWEREQRKLMKCKYEQIEHFAAQRKGSRHSPDFRRALQQAQQRFLKEKVKFRSEEEFYQALRQEEQRDFRMFAEEYKVQVAAAPGGFSSTRTAAAPSSSSAVKNKNKNSGKMDQKSAKPPPTAATGARGTKKRNRSDSSASSDEEDSDAEDSSAAIVASSSCSSSDEEYSDRRARGRKNGNKRRKMSATSGHNKKGPKAKTVVVQAKGQKKSTAKSKANPNLVRSGVQKTMRNEKKISFADEQEDSEDQDGEPVAFRQAVTSKGTGSKRKRSKESRRKSSKSSRKGSAASEDSDSSTTSSKTTTSTSRHSRNSSSSSDSDASFDGHLYYDFISGGLQCAPPTDGTPVDVFQRMHEKSRGLRFWVDRAPNRVKLLLDPRWPNNNYGAAEQNHHHYSGGFFGQQVEDYANDNADHAEKPLILPFDAIRRDR
ncbi:unnamed protein product, partial [Amoebophrya sp. A120]|eukprot:GSA120T00001463001.1